MQPVFNMNAPMALNPKRELSIETLTASVGLIANGVPLNRVESMFFKDMQTGSSTVSENLNQMAKYATPLIERIEAEAHKAEVIIADETPFDVLQTEGRGHQAAQNEATSESICSQTYIHAVTSTTAADKRFVLFYPMAGRSAKEISGVLNAFTPKAIMSDGYAAYTGIVRESEAGIGHASCLVHWRRELLKAANLETQCSYVKRTTPQKALESYRQHIEESSPLTILNMTLYALSRVFAEEQSVIRGDGEPYEAYLLRVKACDDINGRQFTDGSQDSRRSLFEREELPLLQSLPPNPYESVDWRILVADKSHCIKLSSDGGHRYSVPVEYIKQQIIVRLSKTEVRLFDPNTLKPLGTHVRCYELTGQKTHLLPQHLTDIEKAIRRTEQDFIKIFVSAGIVRDVAVKFVMTAFAKSDFLGRKRCGAILSLKKKTKVNTLSKCLSIALDVGNSSYPFINLKIVFCLLVILARQELQEQPVTSESL